MNKSRVTKIRREAGGEEALAIGAFRAGVRFVTGFPGRPSTRTLQLLAAAAHQGRGIEVGWAVNGKTALEEALGASLMGRRALVCLPGPALKVAYDPLAAVALTGCRGGLVILVGDDPGAGESSSEQDSRNVGAEFGIPILEPSHPAEGGEEMEEAFRLSEEYQLPVMLRIVPSFAAMRGEIITDKIQRPVAPEPYFAREEDRWIARPERVSERHERLRWKLERISESFDHSLFNSVEGSATRAVIAAGHVASVVLEIVGHLGHGHFTLCKLGTIYPLPEGLLIGVLEAAEEVAILEENQAVVESAVIELVARRHLDVEIKGRLTGLVPTGGELFRWQIDEILTQFEPRFASAKTFFPYQETREREREKSFCTGCPHATAFRVLKQVIRVVFSDAPPIIVGDPGCALRASQKPYGMIDASYNLGSAVSIATGMARSGAKVPIIALLGDTSFFSAGINSLINAARQRANLVVVIFDNDTSASTGFQPHAGSTYDMGGMASKRVSIEELARACGVDQLRVVNPENETRTRQVFSEAFAIDGLRVIVLRSPCPLIP